MRTVAAALLALCALLGPERGAAAPADGYADRVGFDQHLDRRVPAELAFRDENGRATRLEDYLGLAPVGLVFSYYGCSNLCPTVIGNLAARLARTSGATANKMQVVVVSIDPLDSPALAALAKRKYLERGLAAGGAERWHFLSGAQPDIARLADAVGFRYAYDEASHQYAHPAGFALLTPDGRIARYFFGFDFSAEELAHAIDEAGARRIASPIQRLLQICFHYDLVSGRYSAVISAALQGLSIVLLLGAFALVGRARWRAHRSATPGR